MPSHSVVAVVSQVGRRADGGVASITEILARLRGARVVLVSELESSVVDRLREAGVEVHLWSDPLATSPNGPRVLVRARRLAAAVRANARLYRLLRRHRPAVVHCNDLNALWRAAAGARAAGSTIVLAIRGTSGVGGLKWRLARLLSDEVIVLSDEMRRLVEAQVPPLGGRGAPVRSIYSLVDLERMRPAATEAERAAIRARLGIEPGVIAVGVVGAFFALKGQLELLEALARDPGALPPEVRLYFVGDHGNDEYGRRCLALAGSPPLRDRVRMAGFSPAVRDWYCAVDVTLVASRFEGLARAMIESLACGTPVVSVDVCSAREILDREGAGVVVPRGDYRAMFGAIAALARDPATRARLGAAGPPLARRLFDPGRIVASYEQLYREAARVA